MKNRIKYLCVAVLAVGACGVNAQGYDIDSRYSIKAHGEVGAGGALSMNGTQSELSNKSSMHSFGIDFGYMFWQKKGMSLSLNTGLDYDIISVKQSLDHMNYNYAAGADADIDGNTYQRYYELSGLNQKTGVELLSIPVYVNFTYRFNEWIGIYANVGLKPGFKTSGKVKSFSGKVYSYGIYSQYDNLMMDDEWLNDFGERKLTESQVAVAQMNSFNLSILAGAGIEAHIYGPLYASVGVNYNAGLTNIFKSNPEMGSMLPLVSYSVAQGQQVESLTMLTNKSKINHIGINIALTYRF